MATNSMAGGTALAGSKPAFTDGVQAVAKLPVLRSLETQVSTPTKEMTSRVSALCAVEDPPPPTPWRKSNLRDYKSQLEDTIREY